MSALERLYSPVSTVTADFADGSLPGWLTTETSGGGSVTPSATDLGQVEIATGTTSTGDYARLIGTDGHDLSAADALGYRVVFGVNSGVTNEGDSTLSIQLRDDPEDNTVSHTLNHSSVSSWSGSIRTSDAGSDSSTDTRKSLFETATYETELIVDPGESVVHHRYQDCYAQRVTDNVPSGVSMQPDIYLETQNTASDKVITVSEMELTYYQREQ